MSLRRMDILRRSLFFLSIFCWCQEGQTTTEDVNWLVDCLLGSATQIIQKLVNGQIAIPDMERTFDKRVAFVKLKGGVKATGGVFQNLTTLHRTGNATLTFNSSSASLRLLLGLSDMEMHFNHCRVWLGKLIMSESLLIRVQENSLDAKITLYENNQRCNLVLDYIKMNEFKNFDTKVKGLGILNGMFGFLGDVIMDHFVNNIKSLVEEQLHKYISQTLAKHNICASALL